MLVRRTLTAGTLAGLLLIVVVAIGSTVCAGQPASARGVDGDDDGLEDRFEERWHVTDPGVRDTDGDGIWDGHEDEDADLLSNLGEQGFGTDPTDRDSDDDGTKDGADDSDGSGTEDALEQDLRPVPSDLKPSLSDAFWDVPPSYSNGCHTGAESSVISPCIYGSPEGKVQVALFGDSHALQWLPALDRAGVTQGWRVTVLTKTACPSVDVAFEDSKYSDAASCVAWRRAAQKWLGQNRQDVVIITNAGRYPILDAAGQRISGPAKEPLWQEGLARVIDSMPEQTQVIVLADTPHLETNPVSCLGQGAGIISDCVTRRTRTLLPEHDTAERETARSHGAIFGDLNGVVCPYSPCPIVNGRTLMWRNESHLTATYARQLAPAMSLLVERALAAADAGAGAAPTHGSEVEVDVVVYDDRFEPDLIEAKAGDELIVTLTNSGQEKHGIAFYRKDGGSPLAADSIGPVVDPGKSATMLLTAPDPGEYVVLDAANPEGPKGTFIAREDD